MTASHKQFAVSFNLFLFLHVGPAGPSPGLDPAHVTVEAAKRGYDSEVNYSSLKTTKTRFDTRTGTGSIHNT